MVHRFPTQTGIMDNPMITGVPKIVDTFMATAVNGMTWIAEETTGMAPTFTTSAKKSSFDIQDSSLETKSFHSSYLNSCTLFFIHETASFYLDTFKVCTIQFEGLSRGTIPESVERIDPDR